MKTTRRSILQAIVVVAVPAVQACSSSSEPGGPPTPPVEDGQRYFPQSVASGDPRPGSVILWTRVADDAAPDADLTITLEVATDAQFEQVVVRQALVAEKAHDNALKIKVTDLAPRTNYHYRFIYERDMKRFASKTGRTRTAPAATDDVPVRFAVATCQDFIGRYYNAWQRLVQLDEDLDFIVFLGDYVYETTGDPQFMTTPGARKIGFTDPDAALKLGSGADPYSAAQSVSNYRDLYRAVRSDEFLRAAHERYPFVCIWDDHEYSDDCWGAHANYTDGLENELNIDRRKNAEQAYFEYIPLDHPGAPDGLVHVEQLPRYPDTKIYRDLDFGKHVKLIVADYRTYRPDHLIPEDAYPGTVVMSEDVVTSVGAADKFASDVFAYVDIDAKEYATEKLLLIAAYQQLAVAAGLSAEHANERAQGFVKGPLSLVYVNAVLTSPGIGLPPIDPKGKARGLAWVHMGKRDLFTSRGSRFVIVKDTFDAYAAYQFASTNGASEDAFGDAQQAWIDATLKSDGTWKVLVSSVSLTSMGFDLTDKTDIPDESLRNRYYLNADQWDGFPDKRKELLGKLAGVAGSKAFAISGDIHATFASVEQGVACLTTPAISSQTIKEGARGVAIANGFEEGSAIYKYVVTDIEQTFAAANPGLAFSDTGSHGYMVLEVHADEVIAKFQLIASSQIGTDYGSRASELDGQFTTKSFKVTPGSIVPV